MNLPLPLPALAIAAGVVLGGAYSLSPTSVLVGAGLVALFAWAGRGLTARERMWVWALLGAALLLRLLALAGLFLLTDHDAHPFASFVPDGRYLKLRSLWIRNEALGIPIHPVDAREAFGSYGDSEFLYMMAAIQVMLGPMPYGAHLLDMSFFFAGSVIMYRTARAGLGRIPALGGLAVLLFLPTWVVWSISALKESLYFCLTALAVATVVRAVRTTGWLQRAIAITVCVFSVQAIAIMRRGGFMLGVGLVAGLGLRFVTSKALLLLPFLVVSGLVVSYAVWDPGIQQSFMSQFKGAANVHIGHVNTVGQAYKLLDPRFYLGNQSADIALTTMTFGEAVRFVFRAAVSFVLVPLPWQAATPSALAFIPQQMLWYVLVAMSVIGCYAGFWRDRLLTCILAVIICFTAVPVALSTGNIGTLARFRDMVVPLVVWLSSLGACTLVEWAAVRSRQRVTRGVSDVGTVAHATR